jgi:hypothetical protein
MDIDGCYYRPGGRCISLAIPGRRSNTRPTCSACSGSVQLEQFQEKYEAVFRRELRKNKELGQFRDTKKNRIVPVPTHKGSNSESQWPVSDYWSASRRCYRSRCLRLPGGNKARRRRTENRRGRRVHPGELIPRESKVRTYHQVLTLGQTNPALIVSMLEASASEGFSNSCTSRANGSNENKPV